MNCATNKKSGRLTNREKEVLYWARQGKTSSEIGAILGISHRTAEKHLENLFKKLKVHTKMELLSNFAFAFEE